MSVSTNPEKPNGTEFFLTIGDTRFVVSQPTDDDAVTLANELRRQAQAKVKSPLAAISESLQGLPAAVQEKAIEKAVALTAGGKVQPTQDQIAAQIYEPEGCRFWLWLLARKNKPDLSLEDLKSVITAENAGDVLTRLTIATRNYGHK